MPTMTLTLDDDDYAAIQRAITHYQTTQRWDDEEGGVMLPDGESCLAGAILAECCRDLEEYRALYNAEHPRS